LLDIIFVLDGDVKAVSREKEEEEEEDYVSPCSLFRSFDKT
jgi:hypothetical protein